MKILIALLVLASACSTALAQVGTLVHKEVKRRYIVYTPPSYQADTREAWPVVFNFHGSGMSMAEQMLYTGMNRAADRHRFIVVYPLGIERDWNVGFGMSYLGGSDDVGFTEALYEKLRKDYRIDTSRVYATGLSRGGFFALRLAAELPQVFAAVASVGGPMPEPVIQHHAKTGKVAQVGVMLIHGTADQVVAYDGKATGYLSALDSHRYWVRRNGLEGAPEQQRAYNGDSGDGTEVNYREQAQAGTRVALVTVKDGGHTWPGADPFNVGLPIGKTTRDVDANELMWQFFRTHRR